MGILDRDTAGSCWRTVDRTYVNLSKTLFQDEMISLLTGEIAQRYRLSRSTIWATR